MSKKRRDDRVTKPICRTMEKWQRNWPCFCGSGKKFKRCCLKEVDDFASLIGDRNES